MLPHQTEVFLETLKYHWQNYKTGESAVPLSFFEDEAGLFSEIESERKGVWANVYEPSPFKNEVALLYLIGIVLKSIKGSAPQEAEAELAQCSAAFESEGAQGCHEDRVSVGPFPPAIYQGLVEGGFRAVRAHVLPWRVRARVLRQSQCRE